MQLRAYQIAAIDAASKAYANGKRAPLMVAPTGAGKTVIAAEIIRRANALGRRVMFVAPRRELISQTEQKLLDAGIWDVRVIRAQHDTGRTDAPVIIGSIQTLVMPRWSGRLPHADLLIADEAHHMMASEWRGLASAYSSAHLLGLTATPERADGRPMGDVFDSLIVAASVSELMELGHLAPCRVYAPSQELSTAQLARDPAEAYRRWTPGQQAVVFCTTIAQARSTLEQFDGVRAGVVTASSRDRAEVLARFATGDLQVVINCGVLTEGWDCPSAGVAILARKFGHAGLYLQCVGRVLRPHASKEHATVIDLCGSVHKHGLPDADRVYSLDGQAISTVKRDLLRQCPVCGSVFTGGHLECPSCGAALPRREITMPYAVGEELTEVAQPKAAPRPFVKTIASKYAGTCAVCGGSYSAGDSIKWSPQLRARHAVCPSPQVSL